MATIINSLKIAYSTAIFRHGTKRFPEIMAPYVTPVKEYASATYTKAEIEKARDNGFITEEEYTDTIGLVE
ncbi:hypothetical protein BK124_11600 [Paenibacillus amylolyticus]|uniref:hypothetical protein n=1 Tax=Paenibacillus amylolyticus TaxID=1451 RepID=UPI00096E7749|nr:hypothetical protein [Paenibacillus amylolyticus]OMF00293.1 hypothetical protein BK124_11600 [Paenibacillus amylolyticus]